ncbi:MAG: type II toxin-antitoxin system HicB family antitoxin [Atribacterota bacterium]|nr:type II toxin-antitoxin system HicB family antitoxin [Atribacterota bacterium]
MIFKVTVEKDESGYYVGEVPALPGCLSQGKSIEELKVNIAEAIEGWLEVMKIGILKKLIKQAGLNIDQFNNL